MWHGLNFDMEGTLYKGEKINCQVSWYTFLQHVKHFFKTLSKHMNQLFWLDDKAILAYELKKSLYQSVHLSVVHICLNFVFKILVLNLKQNNMARRHALFLGRHALSDSAMPFCLAPCHQNVPLIEMFTC